MNDGWFWSRIWLSSPLFTRDHHYLTCLLPITIIWSGVFLNTELCNKSLWAPPTGQPTARTLCNPTPMSKSFMVFSFIWFYYYSLITLCLMPQPPQNGYTVCHHCLHHPHCPHALMHREVSVSVTFASDKYISGYRSNLIVWYWAN